MYESHLICEDFNCCQRGHKGLLFKVNNYSAEIAPTGQAASHAPHERQASLSIS